MKIRIHVSLKPGVLDPQGRAVHHALEGLGFNGVQDVRIGRLIELDVGDDTNDDDLDQMCQKLLANMVIENYRIEKVGATGGLENGPENGPDNGPESASGYIRANTQNQAAEA